MLGRVQVREGCEEAGTAAQREVCESEGKKLMGSLENKTHLKAVGIPQPGEGVY